MHHNILLFGALTDFFQQNTLQVPQQKDVEHLLAWFSDHHPLLFKQNFVVAVDKKIIHENTPLNASSEIALLPPFSGG
jgi:sulfur-carrier protein